HDALPISLFPSFSPFFCSILILYQSGFFQSHFHQIHDPVIVAFQIQIPHHSFQPGCPLVICDRCIFCLRRRFRVASPLIDLLLFRCERFFQHRHHFRLMLCRYQKRRHFVQLIHLLIGSADQHRPHHHLIRRISDISQGQRGILFQIMNRQMKFLRQIFLRRILQRFCLLYALFHFTPSLVSSSTIPFASSSSRIASARAKSLAFLAACRSAIIASISSSRDSFFRSTISPWISQSSLISSFTRSANA